MTVPSGTRSERGRHLRRGVACLGAAVALHAALVLFRREPAPALAHASNPPAAELAQIPIEMPTPGEGAAPGGGSEEPEETAGPRAAMDQPLPSPPQAKVALRDEVRRDDPALSESLAKKPEFDPEPPPPSDLLTSPSSDADPLVPEALRPRAARTNVLRERRMPTATAPDAAQQQASTSRSLGYGPGANGGPGGKGSGWNYGKGVVKRNFAFGGPSGAFKADVCFIEQRVRSLAEIRNCPRVATFYTNALNVPPRKFSEGFPGVSARSEWFAIRYTGKFTVTRPDYYTFKLISDDGAILYIDGHRVIDNDGQHPPIVKRATIPLEAGEHQLFVSYYQGPRENIALQLFVAGSDAVERLLGPKL